MPNQNNTRTLQANGRAVRSVPVSFRLSAPTEILLGAGPKALSISVCGSTAFQLAVGNQKGDFLMSLFFPPPKLI